MTRTPELGSLLKSLRDQKELRQEDVANTLSVTRQSVIRWEAGDQPPRGDNARQLELLYGIPPGSLAQVALAEEQLAEVRELQGRQQPLEELLAALLAALLDPAPTGRARAG